MTQRNVRHLRGLPLSISVAESAASLAQQHAVLQEKLLRSAYTDDYSREERDELRELLSDLAAQYESMTGKRLS